MPKRQCYGALIGAEVDIRYVATLCQPIVFDAIISHISHVKNADRWAISVADPLPRALYGTAKSNGDDCVVACQIEPLRDAVDMVGKDEVPGTVGKLSLDESAKSR